MINGQRVIIYHDAFTRGEQCDSQEAMISFFDNISIFGYCTKNSYYGLIMEKFVKWNFLNSELRSEDGLEETIKIDTFKYVFNISNPNYHVQENINLLTSNIRIGDNGKLLIENLVNVGQWLPLFIIIEIQSMNYGAGGAVARPTYPDNLDDVLIYGQQYEITDLLCKSGGAAGGHYVSYNKRIGKDGKVQWYFFDDNGRVKDAIPLGYIPSTQSPKTPLTYIEWRTYYPRMLLLKKVPPT